MLFGCCVNVESLSMVRNAGFDFAELQVKTLIPEALEEWAQVRHSIVQSDIPIQGFNVLLPGYLRIVGPDVQTQVLDKYLDVVFARMSELGGKYLSFGSGSARRIPDGFDRTKGQSQLRDFIAMLGGKGLKYGITVNVEFLNRKETNVIMSLLEADEYVQAADVPSIRILADLYHMMEESEPFSDLRVVGNRVAYVHVADTGRRYPGSGTYPYQEFVRTLKEVGYDGPVSVECSWGTNLETEMKLAANFLRNVFR
ncbi:sugar phosphate isomerase/epimerase [Alicyclobacillus fastidiosus]|uniref:Sugar phosphate isomerase/epimerase n=1 Tax=Alicyclobacillus fastidiosus TaxID=392011 RepID=A0ABY6ZN02_9BACL|nr:sugar phosphate isomerase/epimerase family protein [Alicyclobacillus fastidiosus]WAH43953.1 sugar phosphate isomerase/epimerase [Alicyclobacillus fastidiosus]GMA60211.1 hypothetical protein GCM10025859_06510 [Alicyclobacillus fastidiosus]